MPHAIDPPLDDDSLGRQALRRQEALTGLNVRIARLGLLLGVHLEEPGHFEQVLAGDLRLLARITGAHGGAAPVTHRLRRDWDELRSLLVMRCDLMRQMVGDLGYGATRQIAEEVESALAHSGFRPGADGFELLDRMRAPDADR